MAEFPNPYKEEREQSPGELAQEYAELFKMASFLFGVELTAKEKTAIPLVIGAFLRERSKIDFQKVMALAQGFLPK